MMRIFYFIYFAVKKLLLRPDAILLFPFFIRHALNDDDADKDNLMIMEQQNMELLVVCASINNTLTMSWWTQSDQNFVNPSLSHVLTDSCGAGSLGFFIWYGKWKSAGLPVITTTTTTMILASILLLWFITNGGWKYYNDDESQKTVSVHCAILQRNYSNSNNVAVLVVDGSLNGSGTG